MRLIRFLPLLFTRFRKEVVMFWHVMRHPQTPTKAKLAALLAVIYVVSPIDLIPDFIPVLGWLDDVGMVTLLLSIAYKLLPKDLYESLRAKVDGTESAVPSARPQESARHRREPLIIDVTPQK
jgi:uncharacterized membrane protein YkvA (DUF1232 family)